VLFERTKTEAKKLEQGRRCLETDDVDCFGGKALKTDDDSQLEDWSRKRHE
jgi:hypothetical protein